MKPDVVIVGAGKHAWVVIDILQEMDRYNLVGIVDKVTEEGQILGVPIIGSDSDLERLRQQGISAVMIAVGTARIRRRLLDNALKLGFDTVNAIHPTVSISRSARIGSNIVMMPYVIIHTAAVVEDNVIISTAATIDHHCHINPDVDISPGCHLAGTVSVGENTQLGTGVSVIPEITIGKNVVIGAGTTIYRDVPDNSKVVGAPMRYL